MTATSPINPSDRGTRSLPLSVLIVLAIIAMACVAAGPWFLGQGTMRLVSEILLVLAMAQMWNLLAGYAGLVSFGHQAFVGGGAYAVFAVSNNLGLNPYVSLLAAPIAAAAMAAVLAPLLFRLRDAYFAIGIWVVAEVLAILCSKMPGLGGQLGMTLKSIRNLDFNTFSVAIFWISGAVAIGSLVTVCVVLRSDLGLALSAVRNNERAAQSLGIDVWKIRFVTFVISGAGVGLAGAVYFVSSLQVVPSAAFDLNWAVMMLFITIIGGIGRVEGPIIGAIIYFTLRELFAEYGNWYLVLTGLVAVVTMLLAPEGIWGLIYRRFRFEIFSVRHKVPDDWADHKNNLTADAA